MRTDDFPLISIVMAVYKPRTDWLVLQLESLDKQTYPNLELLVCDDCPECPVDETLFSEHIKAFPYEITRNEKNLGSNSAFEILTAKARGEYISYCDQDDIWHSDKVQRMFEVLEKTGSPLVCSDMNIIDCDGNKIGNSITEIRKRHIFREGNGLAPGLLVSNFVTGCAMMMRTGIAKGAIPFACSLVHDHWLAINAAINGRIEFIGEPLLDYRQHTNNQTGILKNVTDKDSYYNERLTKYMPRLKDYKNRLYFGQMRKVIDDLSLFYQARIGYSRRMNLKDFKVICKYRKYAPDSVLIETFMKFIPDKLFKAIIILAQRGKI